MKNYLELLDKVLTHGEERSDRTGVGTISVFGERLEFDLSKSFPAVTTKRFAFKSMAAELAGFLDGVDSAEVMRELGTSIWDANANAPAWQSNLTCKGKDDLGRVYGVQWRSWNKHYSTNSRTKIGCVMALDQLRSVVDELKDKPHGRRHLVSAWNPGELDQMCLPPCHYAFQLYVTNNGGLDLMFHMRSVDLFLGLPFNIASYALLNHIISREVDLKPNRLIVTMGDTHIYKSHYHHVMKQLTREPMEPPQLCLSDNCTGIDDFFPPDATLIGYNSHPAIRAPMAV